MKRRKLSGLRERSDLFLSSLSAFSSAQRSSADHDRHERRFPLDRKKRKTETLPERRGVGARRRGRAGGRMTCRIDAPPLGLGDHRGCPHRRRRRRRSVRVLSSLGKSPGGGKSFNKDTANQDVRHLVSSSLLSSPALPPFLQPGVGVLSPVSASSSSSPHQISNLTRSSCCFGSLEPNDLRPLCNDEFSFFASSPPPSPLASSSSSQPPSRREKRQRDSRGVLSLSSSSSASPPLSFSARVLAGQVGLQESAGPGSPSSCFSSVSACPCFSSTTPPSTSNSLSPQCRTPRSAPDSSKHSPSEPSLLSSSSSACVENVAGRLLSPRQKEEERCEKREEVSAVCEDPPCSFLGEESSGGWRQEREDRHLAASSLSLRHPLLLPLLLVLPPCPPLPSLSECVEESSDEVDTDDTLLSCPALPLSFQPEQMHLSAPPSAASFSSLPLKTEDGVGRSDQPSSSSSSSTEELGENSRSQRDSAPLRSLHSRGNEAEEAPSEGERGQKSGGGGSGSNREGEGGSSRSSLPQRVKETSCSSSSSSLPRFEAAISSPSSRHLQPSSAPPSRTTKKQDSLHLPHNNHSPSPPAEGGGGGGNKGKGGGGGGGQAPSSSSSSSLSAGGDGGGRSLEPPPSSKHRIGGGGEEGGGGGGGGYLVLPSMAQTVERLLLEAGVTRRDDRVVHLLVDLMQRETLTLLSDAADLVDLNRRSREGRRIDKKARDLSKSPERGGGEGGEGGGASSSSSSMRIEEEHASVAVHEYMQKYLVQPNVVLENARLCSLSNSLTCGTTSTPAELLVHRFTNPSGGGGGSTGAGRSSIGVVNQGNFDPSSSSSGISGGGGGGRYLSGGGNACSGSGGLFSSGAGGGGGGVGMSLGMHALIRGSGGGGGSNSGSTNKNVLGLAPEGLPPYLPEDISVSTLLPSWSLRIREKKKKEQDQGDGCGGSGTRGQKDSSREKRKERGGKATSTGEEEGEGGGVTGGRDGSKEMKGVEETDTENLLLLGEGPGGGEGGEEGGGGGRRRGRRNRETPDCRRRR